MIFYQPPPQLDSHGGQSDNPFVKLIAEARGRLAAMEIFRPGTTFDVTRQPDGSFRVMELVEKEVPVVKLKKQRDGTFASPAVLSREAVRAAIRADRDAQ